MSNARTLASLIDDTNTRIKIPSGYGLDFADYGAEDSNSATTVGSNLMEDYEEGTWTPRLNGDESSTVYGTQDGTYVKVGELVFVVGRLNITTIGSASALIMAGIPFTDNGDSGTINVNRILSSAVNINNIDGGTGGDLIYFKGNTSAGTSYVNMSIFQNGTQIWFSGTYRTS